MLITDTIPDGRTAPTPSRRTNLHANSDGTGQVIGFVYHTSLNWRAYTYVGGIGYGPFMRQEDAAEWVRRQWGQYLTEIVLRRAVPS